ncbi:MAG TPA: formate/nitrite transporter family protein [Thermodesulfobacteriota bacterium]|nr:formate/nitrite transporter family protein [Thermodesulfobacteriota bacterium]
MPDSVENKNENEETSDTRIVSAFLQAVEEGQERLERSWPNLLATGTLGGIDVSLGVLALLIIEDATGSRLLGALGFSIGFIALTLAKSELFEENFLVPITAVVARRSSLSALIRLWGVAAIMNLIGGWVFAWLIVIAIPGLHETAVKISEFFIKLSVWESFALGVIAGAVITLMTWMEHSCKTEFGKIIAVVSCAFLLAAVPMNHVIIISIEIFVALIGGAPFGYSEWAWVSVIATVANMVGGLLFVTFFRLVQVASAESKEGEKLEGEIDKNKFEKELDKKEEGRKKVSKKGNRKVK